MARRWQGLLVHHSGGPARQTVEEIRRYHVGTKGWSDIGYHYVVARDAEGRGHLKRGRSDDRPGAHAGSAALNRRYLGLCVVGCFHPCRAYSERLSDALYADVLGAVVHLMRKYGIPLEGLKRHRDVRATECPGDWFPWERLRADVARLLSGSA